MSLERRLLRHQARSFPRVSGDEPRADTLLPTKDLFSPRERG